jgi:hypothetical protein
LGSWMIIDANGDIQLGPCIPEVGKDVVQCNTTIDLSDNFHHVRWLLNR